MLVCFKNDHKLQVKLCVSYSHRTIYPVDNWDAKHPSYFFFFSDEISGRRNEGEKFK